MRILWVAQWFPPDFGALPARITEMSSVWIEQGHSVTVVTAFPHHPSGVVPPQYRGKLVVRETYGAIDVIRCWLLALPNKRMWQRTLCQFSFSFTAVLLGLWRSPKPDVVIVSSPPFFTLPGGWVFARLKRAPFVFEVRDLWPAVFVEVGVMKKGFAYRVLERMEEFFYRAADKIIVVTKSFREDLVSRGVPEAKIGVIPNGADLDLWRRELATPKYRETLGGDGKFLVAFVGTHGVATGLDQIIEAATILKDDARIAFAFVGEGAEKEKLMAMAHERGLDNVRFHSGVPKDEVKNVYASVDACLICLRNVPLFDKFIPSKMFEIMASEKPVIAALGGEAAGILRDAGNVVVPPGDAEAMAREIRRLSQDPVAAENAGRSGRAYVDAHFNRRELARRYVTELEPVVKK